MKSVPLVLHAKYHHVVSFAQSRLLQSDYQRGAGDSHQSNAEEIKLVISPLPANKTSGDVYWGRANLVSILAASIDYLYCADGILEL
jgi:hypothetical protein